MRIRKLICLGDSNTWGFDPRDPLGGRYPEEIRWCDRLASALGCTLVNLGMNGETFPDSAPALRCLLSRIRAAAADSILIMLGTNDLLSGTSPEQICSRASALLQNLTSCFPDLSVCLLSPPRPELPGRDAGYRDLAASLREAARCAGVRYLELPQLPLSPDGVHLSTDGHMRLYTILLHFL